MIFKQLCEINETKKGANLCIAKYILNYSKNYNELTATEIAKNCYVSNSYITKFLERNNFPNFEKFKFKLIEETGASLNVSSNVYSEDIDKYANSVVDTLIKTADLIDVEQIERVVEYIKSSRRILLFGSGGSGIVCRDMYLKLIKLGYNAIYESDEHLQQFIYQNSSEKDIAIIFSYSGPNEQIKKNIDICFKNKTKSILVTNEKAGNDKYDEIIYVNSSERKVRNISIFSRVAMQMISDLIIVKINNNNR